TERPIELLNEGGQMSRMRTVSVVRDHRQQVNVMEAEIIVVGSQVGETNIEKLGPIERLVVALLDHQQRVGDLLLPEKAAHEGNKLLQVSCSIPIGNDQAELRSARARQARFLILDDRRAGRTRQRLDR